MGNGGGLGKGRLAPLIYQMLQRLAARLGGAIPLLTSSLWGGTRIEDRVGWGLVRMWIYLFIYIYFFQLAPSTLVLPKEKCMSFLGA